MKKKEVLKQIDEIESIYCEECLVNLALRKERGRNLAQSFCVHECTVGHSIKKIGVSLLKNHK